MFTITFDHKKYIYIYQTVTSQKSLKVKLIPTPQLEAVGVAKLKILRTNFYLTRGK